MQHWHVDNKGGEVGGAHQRGDHGGDYIGGNGRGDRAEGRADDDGNSQVYNISTQNKITKAFQHVFLQYHWLDGLACAGRVPPSPGFGQS
jgi:hypothetical protein